MITTTLRELPESPPPTLCKYSPALLHWTSDTRATLLQRIWDWQQQQPFTFATQQSYTHLRCASTHAAIQLENNNSQDSWCIRTGAHGSPRGLKGTCMMFCVDRCSSVASITGTLHMKAFLTDECDKHASVIYLKGQKSCSHIFMLVRNLHIKYQIE